MLFANIPDDVPERRPGIGLSLKVPKLHGVPIGGPFIDIVHRMGIIDDGRGPESVGAGIRLRINTLVALDGLSFRSLDLSDVRQRLTVRGRWKVSVSPVSKTAGAMAVEAVDGAMKALGTSFISPVAKILRMVGRLAEDGAPNDARVHRSHLKLSGAPIGSMTTTTMKWNRLPCVPMGFGDDAGVPVGLPAVVLSSDLVFDRPSVDDTSHFRHNIPLWGLGRDHGRDVVLRAWSRVEQLVPGGWSHEIARRSDQCLALRRMVYDRVRG